MEGPYTPLESRIVIMQDTQQENHEKTRVLYDQNWKKLRSLRERFEIVEAVGHLSYFRIRDALDQRKEGLESLGQR
ncbi:hypothetical protein CHARACLAT_020362 [Characodon lateralis]|uniref:Uncharacterized protein n=1 Tax=Characodon lateralis TaxID=208331 RepID=A0ABU7DKC6_9TELE|nr:hypothetical protein [Characodon lateralis]